MRPYKSSDPIVNIRLAVTLLLLILHQLIRDQLEFRKTLTAAFISMFDPAGGTGTTGSTGSGWPGERDVAMLELLRTQSMDILLHNCRSQVPMMEVGCAETTMVGDADDNRPSSRQE